MLAKLLANANHKVKGFTGRPVNPLYLARLAGFEPATYGLEGHRSGWNS